MVANGNCAESRDDVFLTRGNPDKLYRSLLLTAYHDAL